MFSPAGCGLLGPLEPLGRLVKEAVFADRHVTLHDAALIRVQDHGAVRAEDVKISLLPHPCPGQISQEILPKQVEASAKYGDDPAGLVPDGSGQKHHRVTVLQ